MRRSSQALTAGNIFKSEQSENIVQDSDELFYLAEGYTNKNRKALYHVNSMREDPLVEINGKSSKYMSPYVKHSKFASLGVFEPYTNIAKNPEDFTASPWAVYAASCSTPVLDYTSFKRSQFNKITCLSASLTYSAINQAITTSAAVHVVHAVFKKGASTATDANTYFQINFHDGTTNHFIRAYWDKVTSTSSGATILAINWYGDICEMWMQASMGAASCTLYLGMEHVSGNLTTSDYFYATRAMIVLVGSSYPLGVIPYTPFKHLRQEETYSFEYADTFTFEFDYFPMYPYNTSNTLLILDSRPFSSAYSNINNFRIGYYSPNLFLRVDKDASNRIYINSPNFTTNADFMKWHHLKAVIDTVNGTADLYVDGAICTNKTVAGSIAGMKISNILTIGAYGAASTPSYFMNGMMADLVYKPYLETTTTHYTNGVPYKSRNKLLAKLDRLSFDNAGLMTVKNLMANLISSGEGIDSYGSDYACIWIRFSSGLQAIWVVSASAYATNTLLATGIYYASIPCTFYKPFIDTNYAAYPLVATATVACWAGCVSSITTTGLTLNMFSGVSGGQGYPGYFVIGFWK